MLASIVFVPVLAAVLVAGIPTSSERLAQRVARRSAGGHLSQPMQVVAPNTAVSDTSDVDYTANWSGGVVYTTTDAPWLSVTGQFTVPIPHEPTNGTGRHSVSAWVGIDGSGCGQILQTGIDFTVNGNTVTYTLVVATQALVNSVLSSSPASSVRRLQAVGQRAHGTSTVCTRLSRRYARCRRHPALTSSRQSGGHTATPVA
ncbi:peptidase A4 family-domain-containing protein [Cubamyces menziesii]|nr:peptidase A4 family-domain-containing protein [Cubamyces menziesii]